MRPILKVLMIMHFFVGVGALGGGLAAILNPYEPLGISVEPLAGSPFDSYLVPGLILFTVIGLGHIFSGTAVLFKSRHQGYISSVFSWALMIWIAVQCWILGGVVFLHVLYFMIGLAGAVLAMRLLFEERLFPANLLFNSKRNYRD